LYHHGATTESENI